MHAERIRPKQLRAWFTATLLSNLITQCDFNSTHSIINRTIVIVILLEGLVCNCMNLSHLFNQIADTMPEFLTTRDTPPINVNAYSHDYILPHTLMFHHRNMLFEMLPPMTKTCTEVTLPHQKHGVKHIPRYWTDTKCRWHFVFPPCWEIWGIKLAMFGNTPQRDSKGHVCKLHHLSVANTSFSGVSIREIAHQCLDMPTTNYSFSQWLQKMLIYHQISPSNGGKQNVTCLTCKWCYQIVCQMST